MSKETQLSGDKNKAAVNSWADQMTGRITWQRFIPLSLRPGALVPDSIDRKPN